MTTATTIEIFRLGDHTDKDGKSFSFGEADARELIDAYDPERDAAPIVLGHPKDDHSTEAHGWITGLHLDGNILKAEVGEVSAAFTEANRAGRYRKVSPDFYLRHNRNSPKPGKLYLKSVGMLGASAPAVKGLAQVSFAEGPAVSFTLDAAPAAAPLQYQTKEIEMSKEDNGTAAFAEEKRKLDADKAAHDAAVAAFAEQKKKDAHDANVSFAEAQIAAGKLAPGAKDQVALVLDTLTGAAGDDATVSFAEAGKTVEIDAAAAFRKLFDTATPIVSFAEAAADDKAAAETVETPGIVLPAGMTVDESSAALDAKAHELMRADPTLKYADAVLRAG